MAYTNNNYDGGRANFLAATAMSPFGEVYNETGGYEIFPMAPELLFENPLLGLTTDQLRRRNNLIGGGYLELSPGFFPAFLTASTVITPSSWNATPDTPAARPITLPVLALPITARPTTGYWKTS